MNSLSGKVALGIGFCLILAVFALWCSHGVWFDNPSDVVQKRMDIIGQLVVGIGTAALAVVTWASVYETQQVVLGEDLRFRQSRMPMVSLAALPEMTHAAKWKLRFTVENKGDGPAEHVSVSVTGKWMLQWEVYKTGAAEYASPFEPPERLRSEHKEAPIPSECIFASSYMGVGTTSEFSILTDALTADEQPAGERVGNFKFDYQIVSVKVKYSDVFGKEFFTEHDGTPCLTPQQFKIHRPGEYHNL